MKIAVPLFGSRVSPRYLYAPSLLVAEVEGHELISRHTVPLEGASDDVFLDQLAELEVSVFICGGASREFSDEAGAAGIEVISNVAGEVDEVLSAFAAGRLSPGYGLGMGEGRRERIVRELPQESDSINCVRCRHRYCLEGRECPLNLPGEDTGIDPQEERFHEASGQGADSELRCRVEEVMSFCRSIGYRRLGVAFCSEMFREAELLTRVLERHFRVFPVCCKVGVREQEDTHSSCNAAGQAELLNSAGTDLNLVVGLCLGCDIIFGRHSKAPATTLFVKDKTLANNPVGALYSPHYLEELLNEKERKDERVIS
ncbi:MAG: DUF1847 domain-containing protein [bacterium]